MGLAIARHMPPLAIAVAIISVDNIRHLWWPPLDAWSALLMAVLIASVAAYILGEFGTVSARERLQRIVKA